MFEIVGIVVVAWVAWTVVKAAAPSAKHGSWMTSSLRHSSVSRLDFRVLEPQ